MLVLGLDLSLTSTGIGLIEDGSLREVENIKTKGKRSDTWADREKRIRGIKEAIEYGFVKSLDIKMAVIESPSYGSSGGAAHDRSGLWWLVANMLAEAWVPFATVAPTTRAKYITGSGRAGKDVVLAHAIERYQTDTGPRISNDDIADGVGLADMGARWLGMPVVPDELMPEANLAAMETAHWPDRAEF